jgi:hypothetical protein
MIQLEEVMQSSIPDDYYVFDKLKYFYKCQYNDFIFYIGINTKTDNKRLFVEIFMDEYLSFESFLGKTIILSLSTTTTAILIQYYHNNLKENITFSDAMKIAKLYIDNYYIIDDMIQEYYGLHDD